MTIRLTNTSIQCFFYQFKTYSIMKKKFICFKWLPLKIYAIIKAVYWITWFPWTSTGSSHWEVFLKINLNQKTVKFYTSCVHRKNQCRSTVRKYALLWNKHEYQHSADIFVKNIFNPFHGSGLLLYFLKYIGNSRGFLMITGGTERDQCHEMV